MCLALLAQALAVPAQAASLCDDLWYQRNSIYHAAGYCFATERAERAFGNKGCRYSRQADVPLSQNQRDLIAKIAAAERAEGCR